MPVNYYSDIAFRSTELALDLALRTFIANTLFSGDTSRVIYASNAYCYRERIDRLRKTNPTRQTPNNLDFPFVNYWQTGEPREVEHGWRSALHIGSGIFIDELATKARVAPVSHTYESTAHFAQSADLDYAYAQLSWGSQFPFEVPVALTWVSAQDGVTNIDVTVPNLVKFDLNYNPEFNEQEWLTKEKISTLAMNFTVDTLRLRLVDPAVGNFWIPTTVLFDFAGKENLVIDGNITRLITLAIDQLNGTVTEV